MMRNDTLMDEEITITRREFITAIQQQFSIKEPVMPSHRSHGTAQRMWRQLGGTDHRPKVKSA